MSDGSEVPRGTGNVFADLGDANADAKQLKAQLAVEIIATLDRQSLSVREAAELAHVDPADIQRIRKADLSRFTVDRLLHILAAAA
ncbi:XRE family transcriptional regulator [Siculibacillus lacustris]|uniref:XRE family transcriptional regulator n=1 Tax=Siculibacillus lacustris TaxID=1549641 RepID=A0A4Q9VDS4_9HYPH|nr:helix-turn-helix transcriptional regulator [Siculibacillus lacustris]TBW32838.1 XRE family transcriptional regulator [Siculibacillus lacustris]